ncbi:MAG: tRNA 2-thiouridine(34) synthase MnmA [Candidatus Micrarchaeota archaeon]|nr:tRNA 2-thiouridine(34) synthase MnmA [Candidatus Micrarchaeota archaeon]
MTTLEDLGLPDGMLDVLEKARGKKVSVAMSGGVDSSATAALFKLAGAEVKGIHMLTLPENDIAFNQDAVSDAREMANFLGIGFELFDARQIFKGKVIDYFIDAYLNGKTPNPCAPCNIFIKFGLLMEFAMQDSDYYATGHYAISYFNGKRYCIKKPVDPLKDQTYILGLLSQDVLSKALFPLGHITKNMTREIASALELKSSQKDESQDLCFMKCSRSEYIRSRIGNQDLKGNVVDTDGNVLAGHDGIYSFAIGQRRGIGVNMKTPHFVKDIDPKTRKVTISEFNGLLKDSFFVKDLNYCSIDPLSIGQSLDAEVAVRNKMEPQSCRIMQKDGFAEVIMAENPIWAICPGQIASFYSGGVLLASGFIFDPLAKP